MRIAFLLRIKVLFLKKKYDIVKIQYPCIGSEKMSSYKKVWLGKIERPYKKPKLSYEEQIAYLKEVKGIKFEIISEEKAIDFLKRNTYLFKVKSYAKNYSIYNETYHDKDKVGKYCDLDFAYLVELSTIDMYLREKIVKLALHIEHYLKVQLLRDVTENPNEDGYKTVKDFFEQIRPDLKRAIIEKSRNSYCQELISHRQEFSVWDIVEVLSFGDFIDLYSYYYSLNPCSTKNMSNNLKPVQWLRNAAAHNNCIINHLGQEYSVEKTNKTVLSSISKIPGLSAKMCSKKMSNRPVHDFVVTLYVFNKVVSSEGVKYHTMKELKELFDVRFVKNKHYFQNNLLITSNYIFVKKIIDYFFDLCNNM